MPIEVYELVVWVEGGLEITETKNANPVSALSVPLEKVSVAVTVVDASEQETAERD